MQVATTQLNYDIAFVEVQDNKVNPWHWLHGQYKEVDAESESEYEILTALNGPAQQIVRINNVLTYMDVDNAAYSVKTAVSDSPLPEILRADLNQVAQHYQFNLVGKSRVAGHKAQLVRVVANDKLRFSLWLWLHEETALPLKSAVVNRQGDVLQQIQVTSFKVTSGPHQAIAELANVELPQIAAEQLSYDVDANFDWQINWVPTGFVPTKLEKKSIPSFAEPVDYVMLSDGLVWFSVYIRDINDSTQNSVMNTYLNSGAQTYLTELVNNFEVTVIGTIPMPTAQRLAASVTQKSLR